MDNDQFLDAYLNTLETSEGAGGGDTVTGMATREYGVKNLLGVKEEDYVDNPKGLAKAVAQKNIDELIDMGIDWNNLPLSMKFNSLDIQYNMGSLKSKAPKYFAALKSGQYATAIKQSLDAIGAYDPTRKGERPTKGIAIRRAMFYNLAAKDLGIPTITSINAINQDNPNKSAKVTYNMSEGVAIPVTYEFQSLHSTTKPGKVEVNTELGFEKIPATDEDRLGFAEYVPATARREPSPAVPDAVIEGQPSAERDITIDYEGEMPDIGEDVPLPTIEEKDVASDTTDAIPTAEPEEKNIFSRAVSGVGEFLFGDDDDTPAEPKVDKNEIIRRNLLKELDTSGVPNMNKGGMPMERQMNMFDEGGLLDEGGTIDEQSGNDVPPGSLKEEVRDDIPAQLSEGEFVFPADVVRYWGLEKLMQMRQEAKAGLARMDAMGQMGNSEEATIPDDLPFTLDDLDMEDDPMEFQVGGLVPNQFGITEQPSQFATYNPQPYVASTIPAGQPIQQQPLQTGFTPLTTPAIPTDGTTAPTFGQLLPTTTGRYDELREYINNDTGQTMTIPFVDGKPIYPIPPGFVEVKTDKVEAVETETPTTPQTTQQISPDDDGDSTNDEIFITSDVTGIGYHKNKLQKELRDIVSEFGSGFGTLSETFNIGSNIARDFSKDPRVKGSSMTSGALGGVLDAFRGNADPNNPVTFTDPSRMGSKKNQYADTRRLHEMSSTEQIEIATVARTVVENIRDLFVDSKGRALRASVVDRNLANAAGQLGISLTVDSKKGKLRKSRTGLAREIARARALKIIEDRKAAEAAEAKARNIAFGERMSRKAEAERAAEAAKEGTFERALQEAQQFEVGSEERQDAFGRRDDSSDTGYTSGSVIDKAIEEAQAMVDSGYYDENKGGLMSNKQLMKDAVKKVTKKKRGGLASKK